MSVIVKGMDMPKTCNGCWSFDPESETHGACMAALQIAHDTDKGKPDWCPLEEVDDEER